MFSAEQFIAAVKVYTGVPYSQKNPQDRNGMDCSGVIQAAARDLGLTIARTTTGQLAECGIKDGPGKNIGTNLNDAVPSDILHYAGHEEMWLGGGNVFSEADYGTVAGVRGWSRMTIVGICRYANVAAGEGLVALNNTALNNAQNAQAKDANAQLADQVSSLTNVIGSITTLFAFILDPGNWWRVGVAIFGVMLIMYGIWELSKPGSAQAVVKGAARARVS